MKNTFFALFLFTSFNLLSQVGIGNTDPQAALDIQSGTQGVLLPRVALASTTDNTTIVNPKGGAIAESTLVYNTGTGGLTSTGFFYWDGSEWIQLADNSPKVHVGKAIITGSGTLVVNGLPFKPSSVSITAYANVDAYTLDADNGVANNNAGIPNVFGFMKGYASDNSGSIDQQVIFGGGSGNSINDISRYASPSHCVGLRYVDKNGTSLGVTSAALTSFNSDGFTLNVDSYADGVVIIYEAYK
ncbi:hypothetical protein J1N09_03680 [Aureitalea sp. L0-47]|uniref:hypothetical protein n=1 Tax=Aureitalea sp. L0-47 TaxID=2816962 RepID=UPI00223847B0|nr:hypothetical protein [Aureitalea sp. L0-47]MCW5518924.1 hypothetical protein [Aureitalea sp. L0-47]